MGGVNRISLFKYYRRYLKGGVGANKFYNRIDPYVYARAQKEASRRGFFRSFQREEAIQNVRSRVWMAVKRKRLPDTSFRSFFSYLKSIIVRESVSNFNKREYPSLVMDGIVKRSNPNLSHRVFLGDLPFALRNRVIRRMLFRFPTISPMASKFVLDRIMNGEHLSFSWLRRQYRVKDAKFFLESVMVALRMEIYEIREEVYPLSSSLRDTLYGSFVESQYER